MKLRLKMPKDWSIRWKLTYIAMLTTTCALLMAILGLAGFEYLSLRHYMRGELQMLGEVIGGNCNAAIAFNRADDAQATLATLSAHPDIRGACIYDAGGKILATYSAAGGGEMHFAQRPTESGIQATPKFMDLYLPVKLDGKEIGTVFLRSDMNELFDRLKLYALVSPLILLIVSALSLLLVRRLQRQVSVPIITLAETSRRVSEEKNYHLRAPAFGDDELGRLAAAFNHMLEGIQERDQQIQQHLREVREARDRLEVRVEERTVDLKHANASLQEEMQQRQEAEKNRAEMQANLVEASRKAGMADVATGVLHNVGNVLNSVNVSTQIIHDSVKASRVAGFQKAAQLLEQNAPNLSSFLTTDARGKVLPAYLGKLAGALAEEQASLLREIDGLTGNIAHIREIVAMQQSLSRVSGVHTSVPLGEIIEDAIKINSAGLQRHKVVIERDYEAAIPVILDRHKVLQILINLISNAKYAVNSSQESVHRVRVQARVGNDRLQIAIVDNGVGIDPDQMKRIFGFGFTTKKGGHGFGLHSSALAAKELGGSLAAASQGLGTGATFTLDIPLHKESEHVRTASANSGH